MDKNNITLVSVIVITYNSAEFVLETLESVKRQTWENIELIVTDDGSTDQTVEMCSRWLVKNNNRFRNTQQITVAANTGIPANCNRGLRAAKGMWIKTISGDDILLNTCIADNLEYSEHYPNASFIVSNLNEINEKGKLLRSNVNNEGLLYLSGISTTKKQLKAYTRWPTFVNTPAFFIKKDVIENGGYLDEQFKIYEDMTMVIRMLNNNYRLFYFQKPTVAYRIHQNAISRSEKVSELRKKEALLVFKKYRKCHLNILNPFDLSIYYENWLRCKYKGIRGRKGVSFLRKFSLYYWYMKFSGIQSY